MCFFEVNDNVSETKKQREEVWSHKEGMCFWGLNMSLKSMNHKVPNECNLNIAATGSQRPERG